MPVLGALSGARSFFGSRMASRQPTPVVAPRVSAVSVEASRICDVTGKKRNKANKVCFSNKKSRTFQEVNLQVRESLALKVFLWRVASCTGHMSDDGSGGNAWGGMQKKRLFWEKEQRWVSLKLSVNAMRTIKKKGLDVVCEEYGVDLYSLPYRDVSENRLQWKASNPARPPMPKNPRFFLCSRLCRAPNSVYTV